MMTLGEKLYYYRKRTQLSQEAVAEYLTVSRQAVSKWENDQSRPDTDNLIQLANLYHITLDELITKKQPIASIKKEKCRYCHKKATFYYDYQPFCSSVCQNNYEAEMRLIQKNLKWFYLGIAVGVIVMLIGAFYPESLWQSRLVGAGMFELGTIIVLFPYCTPQTYEMFGVKKTKMIGRIMGMITELIALAIYFLG
ncbi:helix-turn-helix domain-containing protein [Beduini massiliensis]|uniref:helix-turn-helix domain-containing protein n=1 Tax=Beduini massiliensis TaxID=1585974 RepID=UPI001FA7721E|nr:helix-turn-helix transcriptional regulator [Beduini massiliensis]